MKEIPYLKSFISKPLSDERKRKIRGRKNGHLKFLVQVNGGAMFLKIQLIFGCVILIGIIWFLFQNGE